MNWKILFSDDFHINKRNFSALYLILEEKKINFSPLVAGKELWNKYGDYFDVKIVKARAKILEGMSSEQILALTGEICGLNVPVFKIARTEILSYALAKCPSWYEAPVLNDDKWICEKLLAEDPLLLRLNLASVLCWCDIYSREIDDINKINAVIVFSGSQIYQRLLLQLCRATRARVFVVEHFLTGNEFYFEERYDPLGCGSEIRFQSIYNSLQLPIDIYCRQKEINKAINKLLNSNNKNVIQPANCIIQSFSNSTPTILLAAQVQNDFSLLESDMADLNPLSNYKTILQTLLNFSNFNIIVKTHPWEKNKVHLKESFTFNKLQEFITQMPIEYQKRISLCENENLYKMFKNVDVFLTLGSQSAFEACFYGGLKPVIAGAAFYTGRGFTSDLATPAHAARFLIENQKNWILSLEEYDLFLEFLTKLLQLHLPSNTKSGANMLFERINGKLYVPVEKNTLTPKKSKRTDTEQQKDPLKSSMNNTKKTTIKWVKIKKFFNFIN